ncbi:MAG: hypothetical protein V1847_04950 [Candidatus Diapherotrites archaeon]
MNLLAIVDGMADRKCKELGNKTPLQAAQKPALDFFSFNGQVWNVQVLGKKIPPQSDQGVLSLLGVNPWKAKSSRGAMEAFGMNIAKKNKTYFRCNFASFENGKILDRRVKRSLSSKEARSLAKELNRRIGLPVQFRFFPSIEHRGILELDFSKKAQVSNTDPAYERFQNIGIANETFSNFWKPCAPLDKASASELLAHLVNDFSLQAFSVLETAKANVKRKKKGKIPANGLLLRDGGMLSPLPKKHGKWVCVSEMPLEQGIGKSLGMKLFPFPFQGGLPKKVLQNECRHALRAMRKFKGKNVSLYIHFKPLDIVSHDGNALLKKELLETLDKQFFEPLLEILSKKDVLAVSPDHCTPCSLKAHSSDAIPFLAFGPKWKAGRKKYFERSSALEPVSGWKAFSKAFAR